VGKLKNMVKAAIFGSFRLLGKEKAIIFESAPDFGDNTYPVFLEMVKRGLGEKYTLVWSCAKEEKLPGDFPGVKYIYPKKPGLKEKLRKLYYMANARCMICCNQFLTPGLKDQTAFYLTHGVPMKSVRHYYFIPESIRYCLSAGKGVEDMMALEFNLPKEKMFSLGYPRNDILTAPPVPVKEMLETDCKKVIVWYPTFRNHKNGLTAGGGQALPIIHDEEAAAKVNAWAKDFDVLPVRNPHCAQGLSNARSMELSNIRFIGDDFFVKHNTTSYAFVAGCDALLTDYSSIYYDYTLCDKPIGPIWEDIEDYRKNPGYAEDVEEYGKGGVKIYTAEDFKAFLQEVATDGDSCKEERRKLRDLCNCAPYGDSTRRVTDFIIEKAGL